MKLFYARTHYEDVALVKAETIEAARALIRAKSASINAGFSQGRLDAAAASVEEVEFDEDGFVDL